MKIAPLLLSLTLGALYMSRSVHTNLDSYERLSEPDLKQAAVVMAIFVYNTA